jgi:hypothetical protein
LCGAVAFEVSTVLADFDLDHCSRCRKATGSAFAAEVVAPAAGFRWLRGESWVRCYEAPVRREPPGYRHAFCVVCGSPLPVLHDGVVIVPAGALDDDPGIHPTRQSSST